LCASLSCASAGCSLLRASEWRPGTG
jgi:hypothetical protein